MTSPLWLAANGYDEGVAGKEGVIIQSIKTARAREPSGPWKFHACCAFVE
jgi:hypothetical protein